MKAVERAPAKINMTLAITGRRPDGYHVLESLTAFAQDVFDEVMLIPDAPLSLTVAGITADESGPLEDNLVLRAARALLDRRGNLRGGTFLLKKNLPVAAGLGGGSADAAAALRLLARANDLPLDDDAVQDAARATGADVAVCLQPQARVMRGIGDDVGPAIDFLAPHALLVNPRVACPTPAVFQDMGLAMGWSAQTPHRDDADILAQWQTLPNDLQHSAIRLVPAIRTVLDALIACDGHVLARMSGSGATCFGIFSGGAECRSAEHKIRAAHPDWWIARTALG